MYKEETINQLLELIHSKINQQLNQQKQTKLNASLSDCQELQSETNSANQNFVIKSNSFMTGNIISLWFNVRYVVNIVQRKIESERKITQNIIL